MADDRAAALAMNPVSRETLERLDAYVALLLQWQQTTNLIAPTTIPVLWTRHVADSLQLLEHFPPKWTPVRREKMRPINESGAHSDSNQPECAPDARPEARHWIDLGSGGGFPGLVLACALADRPGASVHLVESNGKKAAFLRETARALKLPARVHAERIEGFVASYDGPADVVTARALAPLVQLLGHAFPLLKRGACGLFPKGQDVETELTDAAKCWTIRTKLLPSRTDPRARLVLVEHAEPKL